MDVMTQSREDVADADQEPGRIRRSPVGSALRGLGRTRSRRETRVGSFDPKDRSVRNHSLVWWKQKAWNKIPKVTSERRKIC